MYGLPQAAYHAQRKLNIVMVAAGYKQCVSDPCIYVRHNKQTRSIVSTHVDDLTSVGNTEHLKHLRTALKKEYHGITTERGPAMITGVQMERVRDKK